MTFVKVADFKSNTLPWVFFMFFKLYELFKLPNTCSQNSHMEAF